MDVSNEKKVINIRRYDNDDDVTSEVLMSEMSEFSVKLWNELFI